MSFQQIREVIIHPPNPPHVNNNTYLCLNNCPKELDHLKKSSKYIFFHLQWYKDSSLNIQG